MKPRLIRWVPLLQNFDFHIFDIRGADNPIAGNLYMMENIHDDHIHVNDCFLDKQLTAINIFS